ncbi:hypothetical protein [Nocardia sp. NPDC005366]|uniref:mechanosensitive ion channel family protein n=1 Tax=Nocardia sp. NPDC005366 TaxID=3156878 RepID=UPI0033A57205
MRTSGLAIDFQQGLSDAWSSVATFVPKLAGFLLILLVGWITARFLAAIIGRVLDRIGFDRLVESGGIGDMLARSRYDASDLLAKLAYFAILLIALQLGFGIFGPNPVGAMINGIVAWLPKAAAAIVIVVVAGAIAHGMRDMVTSVLGGLSYGPMIGRIAAVFIWGIGVVAALDQIGVATSVTMPILVTVLATVGGVIVVGVGGGLIRPMQRRWEGWLSGLEDEMPAVKGHARAYQRGREDAAHEQLWMDHRATRPQQQWAHESTQGGYGPGGYTKDDEYYYDDPGERR